MEREQENPEKWAHSTVSMPAAARDQPPLAPGSALEHYEIIRELGHGGMGRVFLARDTRLARLCALKLMREYTGEGAGRFLAEARATARCQHESIVTIYEIDELRGSPYMVLEYLEGRTLRAWMAERHESVPPGVAIELVLPVVRALVCAHEMGIVHRDLKPENIFLTETGQVKVLDFGIAKRIAVGELAGSHSPAHAPADDTGLTGRGALVGTLPYMSPEQRLGLEIGPQTDLWAVGVILHELITGAHPLAPATMSRLLEVQDLERPMPRVLARRPDAGPLGAVIDRCLLKHRSERIGSARELLAELELVSHRKAPALLGEQSPFAGLSAFQESDAGRFFGRDHDVAAVLSRLRNQQLVAVAGPSGAGKSSFVRAGIIPALKRSESAWEAFTLRPGRHPLPALADVLVRVGEGAEQDKLAATLRDKPGALGAALRARCRRRSGDHRILLFVDQFEELYTLGIDPGERAAFLSCLEGVADDASSPLRVMLAMRSDFLDRIAVARHFMTEVTRGLVFLPPMGRDGLREALTRPLDAASYRYEGDELVEQMLDALERTPCPLPLLQFTATELWESRDRDRRLLSRDSYHTLGGIAGALSAHADTVISALSTPAQRLARTILLRLVTPERTRAIVSMAEIRELAGSGDAAEQVVQHLADARLLLAETGGEREGSIVQLVHESLIDTWAKLRQWLDEHEQGVQLRAAPAVPGVPGAVGADGIIDAVPPDLPGPRRVVEVVTHYLEMRAAPGRAVPPPPGVQPVRAPPSVDVARFYRFLYDGVGTPWHWYARRVMPREDLAALLADPGVEVHVLWRGGVPLGFSELDRRIAGEVEIAYFGLFPEAIGQGLGSWLLAWSIAEAWRPAGVERVWVHTCSLDHEAALPVYVRAGFTKTSESRHRQTIVVRVSP